MFSPLKELEFGDGIIDAPNLGIKNPNFSAGCCAPTINKWSVTPSNNVLGSKRTGIYFDLREMFLHITILCIML
jgi:hypothetical protein